MADARPAVDFIGLGAQKAGTTWLFRCLEEHPGIHGARRSNNKELNFFNLHWEYGYNWYDAQFDADDRLCGEFSPQYLPTAGTASRMHRYNPELKLLVALREPVERALSQHRHLIRAGIIAPTMSFGEGLESNPSYLEQGRYARLLEPFFSCFGPERIHVIFHDHIRVRPADVIMAAYDFLGVEPTFQPYSLEAIVNPSMDPRRRGIDSASRRLAPTAKRVLGAQRMGRLRQLGVGRLVRRMSGDHPPAPDVSLEADSLDRVSASFHADNEALADLLGFPVPDWTRMTHPQGP